jgi:hypothetical protein
MGHNMLTFLPDLAQNKVNLIMNVLEKHRNTMTKKFIVINITPLAVGLCWIAYGDPT